MLQQLFPINVCTYFYIIQIIILLMRPIKKTKFELMSECLKCLKQLPSNLESYSKNNSSDLLLNVVQCSNKFIILANDSQQHQQSQISLFHRFFCRVKQNIFSFLVYYLHTNSFIFIRELLIEINKQLMDYRPGAGYHDVLVKIGEVIIRSVNQIAKSKNFSLEIIQQIKRNCIEFVPNITEPSVKTNDRQAGLTASQNLSNPKKQIKQISLSKLLGVQIITDIDNNNLQFLLNKGNSHDAYKQSLNRNRFISQIMSKYKQKYLNYQNKPQRKRNRESSDYHPTTYGKNSLAINFNNPSLNNSSNINRIARRNSSVSHPHRSHIYETKLASTQHNLQAFQFHNATQDDKLKQELLNHIFAYRQKYCVRKVVIGLNDMQNKEAQLNEQIKKFNRTYKTLSASSKSKTQRNQSQTSRLKIEKNHELVKSFKGSNILGVVSTSIVKKGK